MNEKTNYFARLVLFLLISFGTGIPLVNADQAYDSANQPDPDTDLEITRITPEGDDVPAGRQIVFTFDRNVVPVGRMERDGKDIPISITPKLNCEWRWINTSALACQLRAEDQMTLATKYSITVRPGIKTESGAVMGRSHSHSFITQRPKVTYSRFVNWLSPGEPLLQVTFNQPVVKTSVENNLNIQRHQYGDETSVGLEVLPDELARTYGGWYSHGYSQVQKKPDDQLSKKNDVEARRVWLLKPKSHLPIDTEMALMVKPGLISSIGPEKGIEDRTVVTFYTFPEFKFLGVRCVESESNHWTLFDANILISNLTVEDNKGYDEKRCTPLQRVSLAFSVPVRSSSVRDFIKLTPRLDGGRDDYDPWANTRDYTYLSYPHRKNQEYRVMLPEFLQAYEKYDISILLDEFKDEFGRKLSGKGQYRFFTSHRPPRLLLNHPFAVLEKNQETDVPLYVTNLDNVAVNYQKVTAKKEQGGISTHIEIPTVEDVAYATPMKVRELVSEKSGAISGTLTPTPTPPGYYRDPEFFIQITPFQVHAKFGHFSSLVWVTDLSTGQPVKNAKVSLQKGSYPQIVDLENQGLQAKTNKQGIVDLAGFREFDPELQTLKYWHRHHEERYFIRVEKGDDIALLPLDGVYMVRSRNTRGRLKKIHGHTHAWGTTAQGIYKLGDQIDFKIYVRKQSNQHWLSPLKESYSLKVYDPTRKVVHEREDIVLSEFGSFDGNFKVSKQGAVGRYRFELKANFTRFSWSPLTVLVSDFTPAPFKVRTTLNGEAFTGGENIKINARSTLHSGGPYTNAKVRVTARLKHKAYKTKNPLARGFTFGGVSGKYLNASQTNLLDRQGEMNDSGEYEQALKLPLADIYYGSLFVESAVMDERGKFVASVANADYVGRSRFVGLRNTKWVYETDKKAIIEALVVDDRDNIVENIDVDIKIRRREYKVARVKGPGNAYLTKNIMQWVDVTTCKVKTIKPYANCEFTPTKSGSYEFIASIKDDKGREHKTTLHGWVIGKGYVVWDQSNDATLQLVAEQTDYKIGEKARYLVKNPYPGAKALITVERYGVLDSWVQEFTSSTPIIEFPVKADYLPGFYLSVVVISPRVDKPLGEGKVDLGKPSYRMGYITANVSDPYKQLKLTVKTDREVYKPRDMIKASINVKSKIVQKNIPYEIAVAVVDESVLALNHQGRNYYDPYKGFNKLDALDLANYSLISRLVGIQKFEKKGANTGGDGGGTAYSTIRNLFKFVSYWNPSIKPDKHGNASIEFEAPDNLTGWRVLAWAVTPDDMMGLGDTNYKVNRATEIRPVMPNQVVEGDYFKAGFSVMNRSKQERSLKVSVAVKGVLSDESKKSISKMINIKPFQKSIVWLPIKTKGYGQLNFVVKAGDQMDADGLEHNVVVNKRRSLETAATYGTTTQGKVSESIKIPKDIYTDVGGVSVVLAPSVIGNVDGAFKYVKNYPHVCWEQRLTKAVMASSYIELKEYLKNNLEWDSASDTVNHQLSAAARFQAPNGGMTYWLPRNQYVSPYLSAYTAVAFNWLRRDGYEIPIEVETRLHDYLLSLIRQDVFPSFFSKGMSSSVRAVALAALAEHNKIDASDIERYLSHLPEMDLFGRSHFLQAAIKIGDNKNSVKKVVDSILGHASQTGGKFQFNEPWDDSYKYILATPLRSNCSILSGLLVAQKQSDSAKVIADIPFKLVRSITQSRGNRDHWENTQENVFCMNALIDYSNLYENEDPSFKIKVKFDKKVIGKTSFSKKSDSLIEIKRPMQEGDEGKQAKVEIMKTGKGRVYYSARLAYDLKEDNRSRINSGIEVRREYSVERDGKWIILSSPMKINRGELVKIDLFVSVPTARHFVVLNDPVPGGLEPVNSDLATTSVVDANKGNFKASEGSWWFTRSDWSYYGRYFWSFYHKELRHDSARFYADYLPAGNYHLSYTSQAIAEGDFSVMPTHIEEMYDPDVYGKGIPTRLNVNEMK